MLFNSVDFLVFFAVFYFLYLASSRSIGIRNVLILLASYFFYGYWDWRFLSLIFFSTVVDFYCGQRIQDANDQFKRKLFLMVSLGTNLGLLCVFKYLNFFIDSFIVSANSLGWQLNHTTLNIILPVGISFYTFQTLSYSLDIYFGRLKPTRNFIQFAAFVSFFPQLVAGPIERAKHLLPQFSAETNIKYQDIRAGIFLVLIGLIKKVLIADRLAVYVDPVFDSPGSFTSLQCMIAVVFFSIQIYCDFSGYSDVARGVAKFLGFNLMVNFRSPYFATSIKDFWSRWHISLSTWFRDYVYIPLGGSRGSGFKTDRNLITTFLISGVWHGANYTFIIWGILHGTGQVIENKIKKIKLVSSPFVRISLGRFSTLMFVLVCWVFFRSENLDVAFEMLSKMLQFFLQFYDCLFNSSIDQFIVSMSRDEFFVSLYLIVFLLLIDGKTAGAGLEGYIDKLSTVKRWMLSWFLLLNFLLLAPSESGSFIYFQF